MGKIKKFGHSYVF